MKSGNFTSTVLPPTPPNSPYVYTGDDGILAAMNKDMCEISEEIKSINYKIGLCTGRLDLLSNDLDKKLDQLKFDIMKSDLDLKVEIIKYISENSWKTVSLLLAAQTGILTIFGFIQHFFVLR